MTSNDFELLFYDEEETPINDDYSTIHCNSNIIIKRIPLWMSKNNKFGNVVQHVPKTEEKTIPVQMPAETTSLRSKIQAKPMPTYTGYVCFRCGQKGHFIQFCPTNIDKSYDFIKLRKPTGIPKAFLKQINKDENEDIKGLMVTEKGLVKAEPQIEEWNKLKMNTAMNIPDEFKCKACNTLYSNPVTINCGHVFCEECISSKERCLYCEKKITSVYEDCDLRKKIEIYFDKKL